MTIVSLFSFRQSPGIVGWTNVIKPYYSIEFLAYRSVPIGHAEKNIRSMILLCPGYDINQSYILLRPIALGYLYSLGLCFFQNHLDTR